MFKQFSQHFSEHCNALKKTTLNDLFAEDPQRYSRYQIQAADLCLDFSRQAINQDTLKLLDKFCEQTTIQHKIKAMFAGEKINSSEQRAALHTALRGSCTLPDINKKIEHELKRMTQAVQKLHQHAWQGATQKTITDIVNIGIGGSDLGPRMVVSALKSYQQAQVKVHFVANVDATEINAILKPLNPETTLFILASKSFSTQETLINATYAKNWLQQKMPNKNLGPHFIAVTAHPEKAITWGIPTEHIFTLWDFIGGRYSVWSSMGLAIALQIGMEHFEALLTGAQMLDQHFLTAPPSKNLPLLLAFLSVMNQNFYGAQSHAILPYSQDLYLLPSYLQQVEMESNGKNIDIHGNPINYQTGVVLWGGVGTNGQHSFHQLLHQGTLRIPVDFILPLTAHHPYSEHQQALIANCLAQAEALRQGNSATHPPSAKLIKGNRPANIIFMPSLTPQTLGALLATYEHKVFIESLIWDINAFDQWGVELGKQLAQPILQKLNKVAKPSPAIIAQLLTNT